jgi:hypothetical protein
MDYSPHYKHSIETPTKDMNQPLLKDYFSIAITFMGHHDLIFGAGTM